MKQRTIAIIASALCLAATTGCGERSEPTSVTTGETTSIVLSGRPNASDLCIYQASATGAFGEVGLEVSIEVPPSQSAPLEMLGNGRAEFALTTPSRLLTERDGGAPFLAVAAPTVSPLANLPKPGASGAGSQPLIVASTKETLAKRGSVARRLLQAIGRSCDVTAAELKPGATALSAARRASASAPAIPSAPARRVGIGGHPWGWQDPAEWALLMTRLRMRGEITRPQSVDLVYTNEFLAGEGL